MYTNNINSILQKKKFILSALNLAFLAYWYKFDYFYNNNNFILWPDGLFAKLVNKKLHKIPGRYLFHNLKIPKNIKRIIIAGNADKKVRGYLKNKFDHISLKFIKLPFSNIDQMIKYIPKIFINDLVVLTIPTPKQELLAIKILQKYDAKVICLGGSLNMLAGKERPTPNYMYRKNLEFIWRLRSDTLRRATRLLETTCWFILGLLSNSYKNIKVKQ